MNKYVDDLQIFQKKLCSMLTQKNLIDKNGCPDPIKLHNALYPNDAISEEDISKFGRSYFSVQTRKESNWIKGKNLPKRISDILLLCNTFDCDFDYFFTDMPCRTHDVQFIHDYTGLSSESIDVLSHFSKIPKDELYTIDNEFCIALCAYELPIKIINEIIEDTDLMNLLLLYFLEEDDDTLETHLMADSFLFRINMKLSNMKDHRNNILAKLRNEA